MNETKEMRMLFYEIGLAITIQKLKPKNNEGTKQNNKT